MSARARAAAGVAAIVASSAGVLSCGDAGELIVVVQSDVSMPKDIDAIEIEASVDSVVKYRNLFEHLGTSKASIKLPATLALLAPAADPAAPVKIRVIGKKGGAARVEREVVTTIPENRVATLDVKLEGLCIGFNEGSATQCAEGQTCKAGSCASSDVSSTELPGYSEGDIFGGGTGKGDGACFDVTQCFVGAASLTRSAEGACTYLAPTDTTNFNVAVLTEITGMCGAASCLLALDAGSASGWTPTGTGLIALPSAVCAATGPTRALGVVYKPVTAACPLKTAALPTCGPWSSVGKEPETPTEPTPVVMATSQARPLALAVGSTGVYWTNQGVLEKGSEQPASVIRTSLDGGLLGTLAIPMGSARGVAAGSESALFAVVNAPADDVRRILANNFVDQGSEITQVAPSASPDGVAVAQRSGGDVLFWAELGAGAIRRATEKQDKTWVADPAPVMQGLIHPANVAASDKLACWTDEGMLMMANGLVGCADVGSEPPLITSTLPFLETPRAIAVGGDYVYWATFTPSGQVVRARWAGGGFEAPEVIAEALSFPNGVAADAEAVYWTTWGDGKVWRKPLTKGGAAKEIASAQDRPSAIAAYDGSVYWITEGPVKEAKGTVMRLVVKP